MPVMPRSHVLEGRYDEAARLNKQVSKVVQDALMSALGVPPDDFFQIIHVLPRSQCRHTPSFLGLKYSGRPHPARGHVHRRPCPEEKRAALLKAFNENVVKAAESRRTI